MLMMLQQLKARESTPYIGYYLDLHKDKFFTTNFCCFTVFAADLQIHEGNGKAETSGLAFRKLEINYRMS